VTRQIVDKGDPLRRGCDQSESIGADMKSTIHQRVLQRTVTGKATQHKKRNCDGVVIKEWTQRALKTSRVMQAFRAECVRERILREPASATYLQRKHARLLLRGRASAAQQREAEGAAHARSVEAAYRARLSELQREGGEPAA
jgi:hypothetical protein